MIILDNKNEKLKDELTHFGILGMKWGKRKGPGETDKALSKRAHEVASKKFGSQRRKEKYEERYNRPSKVKKIATGVAVGAAVTAIALVASSKISNLNKKSINKGKTFINTMSDAQINTILNNNIANTLKRSNDWAEAAKRFT